MSDLSGAWSGSYIYPGELEPVLFGAEIRDHDGKLSGVIAEPAPWLSGGTAHSVMSGAWASGRVGFVKIYDAVDNFPDPVLYEGTLDADECEISGQWRIGSESGGFIMTRPKSQAVEVEQTEKVSI